MRVLWPPCGMKKSRREGAAYSRSSSDSYASDQPRARDEHSPCTEAFSNAYKRRHTSSKTYQNRRYRTNSRSNDSPVASRLRSQRLSKSSKHLPSSKSLLTRKSRKQCGHRKELKSLSRSRPRISSKSYSHCSRRSRRGMYFQHT
ncbi:hypothetical protein ABG067_002662 [Albugo candida]